MQKISLYDKILSPIVTEKSTNISEQNKVVFKIPANANIKSLNQTHNLVGIFHIDCYKLSGTDINGKNEII